MLDKVKSSLFYLMNSIQAGIIYSDDHPKFKEFIDKLYAVLQDILKQKKEFIIGIVNGELAWENEIFFDLSEKLRSLIIFFEESNIQRIVFQQGLRNEELTSFISFLTRTKRKEQIDEEEYFSLHGIQNIRAGRIKSHVNGWDEKKTEEIITQYENSLQTVSNSLNMVLNEEEIDYMDLRFNILNIMENFVGRHQALLNLISVKKKDLITFVHLLNVSLLSMFFVSKLGFAKEDVLDIGIASLYHDIGKLSISQKILKKKSKLAEGEFTKMKDHSLLGANILYNYKESLGTLPIVIAFEHHLRYDLTGYPKLSYPPKPHIVSLIVSLCDVYDALALRRTYKKDYPPNKIYELMMLEKGKLFDPQLLDRFFQILGVWPVGTIVSLNDKSIAVVREPNEQNIFNPKVEVVSPKQKRGIINLIEREDLQITGSLNPYGEGKKYLHHI